MEYIIIIIITHTHYIKTYPSLAALAKTIYIEIYLTCGISGMTNGKRRGSKGRERRERFRTMELFIPRDAIYLRRFYCVGRGWERKGGRRGLVFTTTHSQHWDTAISIQTNMHICLDC